MTCLLNKSEKAPIHSVEKLIQPVSPYVELATSYADRSKPRKQAMGACSVANVWSGMIELTTLRNETEKAMCLSIHGT